MPVPVFNMVRGEELIGEQWAVIKPHLPELPSREGGRGRPWLESREVTKRILRVLRSGGRWKDLPGRFPPYRTSHRVEQSGGDQERIQVGVPCSGLGGLPLSRSETHGRDKTRRACRRAIH